VSGGADPAEQADAAIELVRRVDDRARIDALLDGAATGSSGVVVVAGPPGVGKTALLDHAVHRAAQFRILRVAGVESETAFAYAGVHQLVGPILDHVGTLADPQRAPPAAGTTSSRDCPMTSGPSSNRSGPAASASTSASTTPITRSTDWSTASSLRPR